MASTVQRRFRLERGDIAIIVIFLLCVPVLFRPVIQGADPIGYYSWLRSAVIEGTLNVKATWEHFEGEPILAEAGYRTLTPTGYLHNQWAAGSAMLWAPFYVVAHGAVKLANLAGGEIPPDGFSLPYVVGAACGTLTYALLGLLLLYRIARRYFTEAVAAGAVIVCALATPFVFYTFASPFMAHSLDAFMGILFVYVWLRARDRGTFGARFSVGLAIGLAMWVRTQNLLLLVVPAFETLESLYARREVTLRERILAVLERAVPLGLGALLFILPLMTFWRVVYGQWLVNTYSATQGGFIDLQHPHLLEVLFSTNRGLFIWSPIVLFSVAGTYFLWRHDRRLTVLLTTNFLMQYYLIASLVFWSGSNAFGARYFVPSLCYFALGLAALADWLHKRVAGRWLIAVGAAFVVWNFLLLVQYALELVPRGGDVDLAAMVRNQFTVVPSSFQRLWETLTDRLGSS